MHSFLHTLNPWHFKFFSSHHSPTTGTSSTNNASDLLYLRRSNAVEINKIKRVFVNLSGLRYNQ